MELKCGTFRCVCDFLSTSFLRPLLCVMLFTLKLFSFLVCFSHLKFCKISQQQRASTCFGFTIYFSTLLCSIAALSFMELLNYVEIFNENFPASIVESIVICCHRWLFPCRALLLLLSCCHYLCVIAHKLYSNIFLIQ